MENQDIELAFPVRCYSCGKVLAHLWPRVLRRMRDAMQQESAEFARFPYGAAMDAEGIRRICCRRMVITHVEQPMT